tara:strand:- start:427 stop:615 length:189 start_codon:yes stop_codon:yes gene_type:complete
MNERISDVEIEGRFKAMTVQRDNALNQVVMLMGNIATLEAKIADLEKKPDETSNVTDIASAA